MAESINKKDLGDRLIKRLDIVFATAKTRDFFIKDAEFQRLIGKQILILSSLGFEKESARFVTQAKETSKAFEAPKYIAPASVEDALDEVNFLDIYIKNTFKKGLEELRDEEIEAAKNPQKSNPAAPEGVAGAPSQRQRGFFQQGQQANPFANPFFGQAPGMTPHPLQDPNFYPYTTKPKYMPILRNVLGILFLLMALMQILVVVAQAVNKGTVIGYVTDTSGAQLAVSYPYANNIIIPVILACLIAYLGYQYLRPTKYDRVKYRANASGAITWALMICVLQIINDFWIANSYNVLTHRDDWLSFPTNNASSINMLFATEISFYSLGALMIVVATIVQFLNPPVDHEKVANASQEWFENVQGHNPNNDNG